MQDLTSRSTLGGYDSDQLENTSQEADDQQSLKVAQAAILKIINPLKKKAMDIQAHPTKLFEKYEKYYSGAYSQDDQSKNIDNHRNIVNLIVEA